MKSFLTLLFLNISPGRRAAVRKGLLQSLTKKKHPPRSSYGALLQRVLHINTCHLPENIALNSTNGTLLREGHCGSRRHPLFFRQCICQGQLKGRLRCSFNVLGKIAQRRQPLVTSLLACRQRARAAKRSRPVANGPGAVYGWQMFPP